VISRGKQSVCKTVPTMAQPTLSSISYIKFCSRLKTSKVTGEGYMYTKRSVYKGAEDWKFDLRNVCHAGVVFKNGAWIKTKVWVNGEHKSHVPDFDMYIIICNCN
jgi:hypothetical protein